MKYRVLSLVILMGACAGSSAQACSISAQLGSAAQIAYDPFSPSPASAELVIALRNASSEACDAQLFLAPVDGATLLRSGQYVLRYGDQQYRGSATRSGEFGPYRVQVPANGSETLRIPLMIEPSQVVPRGDYVSDLSLHATTASGEPLTLDLPTIAFRAEVLSRILMNIAGTTAPAAARGRMAPPAIDFGTIAQGATERVFLNVWANSSVSISIRSENGGELRREGVDPVMPVRYQTSFDGQPISLSAPHLAQRTPPLNIDGANYELAFTLLDSGRLAGVYRDTVTVTVDEN
jgi:hypothetical protein